MGTTLYIRYDLLDYRVIPLQGVKALDAWQVTAQ